VCVDATGARRPARLFTLPPRAATIPDAVIISVKPAHRHRPRRRRRPWRALLTLPALLPPRAVSTFVGGFVLLFPWGLGQRLALARPLPLSMASPVRNTAPAASPQSVVVAAAAASVNRSEAAAVMPMGPSASARTSVVAAAAPPATAALNHVAPTALTLDVTAPSSAAAAAAAALPDPAAAAVQSEAAGATSRSGLDHEDSASLAVSSASSSTTGSPGFSDPVYLRVLVVDVGGGNVLLERRDCDASWDYPYFSYPTSNRLDVPRLLQDLASVLGVVDAQVVDTGTWFVNCELLGDMGSYGRPPLAECGYGRLYVVEAGVTASSWRLPKRFAWQSAAFVERLPEYLPIGADAHVHFLSEAHKLAVKILTNSVADNDAFFVDPRYRFGWAALAAAWLIDVVNTTGATCTGPVTQHSMTHSSTLLQVATSAGPFFLKAPALGLAEVPVTKTIAALFPESTLDVMATCEELNAFVSRGFCDEEPRRKEMSVVVQMLGNVQLASTAYLDELRAGGVEDRGPAAVALELRSWMDDDCVRRMLGHPGNFKSFCDDVPALIAVCDVLATSLIPPTLVHGDFARRNVATQGGLGSGAGGAARGPVSYIIFDWQYTCVGHPFYDLHEVGEDLPVADRAAYLRRFAAWEPRESVLFEAYEACCILGFVLKMWTTLDVYRACNLPETNSSVAETFSRFFDEAVDRVKRSKWHPS